MFVDFIFEKNEFINCHLNLKAMKSYPNAFHSCSEKTQEHLIFFPVLRTKRIFERQETHIQALKLNFFIQWADSGS